MTKAFQILAIALVTIGLAAGSGYAGPGRDNGDPDIPSSTIQRPSSSDVGVNPASNERTVAVGSSRAIDDASQGRWLRALRTYLRLVRILGP